MLIKEVFDQNLEDFLDGLTARIIAPEAFWGERMRWDDTAADDAISGWCMKQSIGALHYYRNLAYWITEEYAIFFYKPEDE